MEITREPLEWSSDDTAIWANFLNTQTGRRLIPRLAELAPRLLGSGETNAILVRNGELLGFQSAIQSLLELSTVNQAPPTTTISNEWIPLDAPEQ